MKNKSTKLPFVTWNKIFLPICLLLTHELLQTTKLISFITSHHYTETVTIIMYYVTRDAYVMTSLWNKVSSCYPPSWAHVVKPSSCFVLSTLDNILPILLHGGSVTELTFNSHYCCRRFLVEPSRTSLFFKQCLLLSSSIVTAWYHLWKLPSSHLSSLCEIRCSSYTSIPSPGTKCLTPKLPMALPVLKLLKILVFVDHKSPRQNHSRSMAIAPTTGSCGNNDG